MDRSLKYYCHVLCGHIAKFKDEARSLIEKGCCCIWNFEAKKRSLIWEISHEKVRCFFMETKIHGKFTWMGSCDFFLIKGNSFARKHMFKLSWLQWKVFSRRNGSVNRQTGTKKPWKVHFIKGYCFVWKHMVKLSWLLRKVFSWGMVELTTRQEQAG